ncbi:flagellar hook assembly protein FlgD [Brevundimonas sp.]|uniref:flagellar hook assembly protein FlgD n=1 Tax=Brevundimonas sp. TaxID=1871086 RepID=UPI0025F1FC09|nr:flagellar hook assembly protein FlgD [Brevundimonas sp.]
MPVDAIGSSSVTAAGRTNLVSNFETFLKLLTTQLKNQDPLSPLDSNDFTAQLTQMAGVEQQLLTNDLLQALVNQGSVGLDSAVHYIGKEIVAAGSAVRLDDGAATWSYELAANAAEARLDVLDSTGRVVWTGPATDLQTGVHDFTWDGRDSSGAQLPDGGVYTLRVSATTAGGQAVTSQVLIRGVVSAVELYDGVPYVTVGGSILPMSQIISVNAPRAQAAADDDDQPSAASRLMSGALDLLNPIDELASLAGAINPLKLL